MGTKKRSRKVREKTGSSREQSLTGPVWNSSTDKSEKPFLIILPNRQESGPKYFSCATDTRPTQRQVRISVFVWLLFRRNSTSLVHSTCGVSVHEKNSSCYKPAVVQTRKQNKHWTLIIWRYSWNYECKLAIQNERNTELQMKAIQIR